MGRIPRDRLSPRVGEVFIQSRDLRPLDRLLSRAARRCFSERLPDGCVLDGEIVIATPRGLDFDALQLRLHPAASRVAKLAEGDAGGVRRASTRLALDGPRSARARRSASAGLLLEQLLAGVEPPDPPDADDATIRRVASEWLDRFEGAGLDGVIAKPAHGIVRARQARDDQGEARADGRLRGGGVPLAQGRKGRARRLAAARALRRSRERFTTWASLRRSRWPRRQELVVELAPLRRATR